MARYAKSDLTTIVGLSGRAIAVACLTGILVGVVGAEASAQVPTPDRPLLCQLSQETADLLASEIEEQFTASGSTNGIGSVADPAVVDVVVIYRLDRSNWGQPIVDNKNPPLTVGTTARVICATEGITKNFADEDDRFPGSGSVDILNADETLAVRVSPAAQDFSAKLCLTSNPSTGDTDTVDCVTFDLP